MTVTNEEVKGLESNYKKALVEVEQILNELDEDSYNKIPQKFIQMMRTQKDRKYKPNMSFSVPLKEQSLLKETKAILAVVYRMYLCR